MVSYFFIVSHREIISVFYWEMVVVSYLISFSHIRERFSVYYREIDGSGLILDPLRCRWGVHKMCVARARGWSATARCQPVFANM